MISFLALLLRLAVLAFVTVLIAGATLTIAAERIPTAAPTLVSAPTGPKTLVVPDVTGQAYVFAKGILEENGFAWHIIGSVHGYAANLVTAQTPAGGTKVYDTGAPLMTLALTRNPSYREQGTPQDDAPYHPTPLRPLPGESLATGRISPGLPPAQTTPVQTTPTPLPTETAPTSTITTPVQTTPAPTTPAQPVTPAPPVSTPVATTPAPTTTPTATTPSTTPTPATRAPAVRQPDFILPGAPKEPKSGQALPDRATALSNWLEAHKQPSAVNLNYWLYEHAYIVAGAKFGWWHGADALLMLIEVDRRAESLWGVGKQSEQTARKALAEVQGRAR